MKGSMAIVRRASTAFFYYKLRHSHSVEKARQLACRMLASVE